MSYPAASGHCLDAAREILPVALQRSAAARSLKLLPQDGAGCLTGYFVVPRQSVGGRWFHHYTVELEEHYIDALTGVGGSPCSTYLQEHWKYPESLVLTAVDLNQEEGGIL